MKKLLIIMLCMLALAGCSKSSDIDVDADIDTDADALVDIGEMPDLSIKEKEIIAVESVVNNTDYSYRDSYTSSGDVMHMATINIYYDGEVVQTLSYESYYDTSWRDDYVANGGDICHFIDMNFDGYIDIATQIYGSVTNQSYKVWIYDPETELFAENVQFGYITNPIINTGYNTILSSNRSSGVTSYTLYCAEGDDLVTYGEIIASVDENGLTYTENLNGYIENNELKYSSVKTTKEITDISEISDIWADFNIEIIQLEETVADTFFSKYIGYDISAFQTEELITDFLTYFTTMDTSTNLVNPRLVDITLNDGVYTAIFDVFYLSDVNSSNYIALSEYATANYITDMDAAVFNLFTTSAYNTVLSADNRYKTQFVFTSDANSPIDFISMEEMSTSTVTIYGYLGSDFYRCQGLSENLIVDAGGLIEKAIVDGDIIYYTRNNLLYALDLKTYGQTLIKDNIDNEFYMENDLIYFTQNDVLYSLDPKTLTQETASGNKIFINTLTTYYTTISGETLTICESVEDTKDPAVPNAFNYTEILMDGMGITSLSQSSFESKYGGVLTSETYAGEFMDNVYNSYTGVEAIAVSMNGVTYNYGNVYSTNASSSFLRSVKIGDSYDSVISLFPYTKPTMYSDFKGYSCGTIFGTYEHYGTFGLEIYSESGSVVAVLVYDTGVAAYYLFDDNSNVYAFVIQTEESGMTFIPDIYTF